MGRRHRLVCPHFPGKTFNLPIIPDDTGQGQFPFPEIDDAGCVYTQVVPPGPDWSVPPAIPADTCGNPGAVPDQNEPLLELASRRFAGRLILEFENLETNRPASTTVVDAAVSLGTMTAFMTNNYFAAHGTAGAACSGGFVDPHHCTDSSAFLALLAIGIYPQLPTFDGQSYDRSTSIRSQFVEVFAPDVVPPECSPDTLPAGCGYPSAIAQAHALLVDHEPPAITLLASPSVLAPPTSQPVPVAVSGQISDDLSGVDRSTAVFTIRDGDGIVQPSTPILVGASGRYSFTVALAASGSGSAPGARHYRITVSARDVAGNTGSAAATVVVPHDQGP